MKLIKLLALSLALGAGFAVAQDRTSTLIYGGDWTDLITADPGVSYEFTGGLVTDNLYETLVKFEGTDLSTLKPGLAEKWDVKNTAQGWVVTFNLRKGSKFSTGREVTAKDVVYTFERVLQIKGPSSFLFTDVANIKAGSTKAVDNYTVQVTLPKTASPQAFLNLLTFNIGGIVDSEEVKSRDQGGDYGKAWLTDHSAGSGPFVLNRWDRNAQVVMTANPNARLQPKLKQVVLRYLPEAQAQRVALESGEIDISENPTPEMLRTFASNPKFKVYKSDNLRLRYIGMNSKEGSPFANPKVRQAVRYAINQDEIINDLILGNATKIQTIIPKGLLGYNAALPYPYDPAQARKLLAEAGVPNGFEFELLTATAACDYVPCADLAAKIQADLAKVGLKANIKQIQNSEVLKTYRAQAAQMVLVAWSPDFPDPDGNATPMSDYNAKSLAYRNVWNNPTAAKLAQQAALEATPAKRAALYKILTDQVLKDGPYAILYQPAQNVVLSSKVEGYVRNGQNQVRLENVSKQP